MKNYCYNNKLTEKKAMRKALIDIKKSDYFSVVNFNSVLFISKY